MTVIVQQPTDSNGNPQPMVYDQDTGKIIVDHDGYVINGGKRLVNIPTKADYVSTAKTQTYGWQEAVKYLISQNGGTMLIKDGVYDMTNAPFQSYTNNAGSAYTKILIPSQDPSTNPVIPIKIIGETSGLMSGGEITDAPLTQSGVILYDETAGSSTQSYILGVEGTISGLDYLSNISIEIDNIGVRVAAGNGIGGIDLKSCITGTVGTIFLGVNHPWILPDPTNSTQIGINLAGQFDTDCVVKKIVSTGGLYNTIGIGHHPIIDKLVVLGDLNAIYIDNEIHEGLIVSADIEYVQNIFNVSSSYAGSGVISPLKIVEMSVANNNSHSNGATWQNPVDFVNNPSAITIFPILIDELWYYGGIVPNNYYPTENFVVKRIIYSNTTVNSTTISGYAIPTTPTVPTSATAQENSNPYAIDVYIYGGDVTEIQITRNGTAHTVLSVSTAIAMSGQLYELNPGDSITVTYSTAPDWTWLSD